MLNAGLIIQFRKRGIKARSIVIAEADWIYFNRLQYWTKAFRFIDQHAKNARMHDLLATRYLIIHA